MSRKNINRYEVATSQSMAASFNTAPTVISHLDNIAYQINITTSDSVGVFQVQASLDYAINETTNAVSNSGTWVSLTLAGGTPVAGAANDSILINLNQLPFVAVRIAYTASVAGTGHCDIWLMSKQLG